MVSPQNTAAIARATKRSWAQWLTLLDDAGATTSPHAQIAAIAEAHMPPGLENPGWWAQGTAVAYEQERGLRVPGQSSDGTFKTSVSRTLAVQPSRARESWAQLMSAWAGYAAVELDGDPWTSDTPKRLYWRARLTDGSKVVVSAEAKGSEKTLLTLSHEQLVGPEAIAHWKAQWKAELQRL